MKRNLWLLALGMFFPVATVFAQGALSIQANHATVCPGTAVTLYAIGGTSVSWQPGGATSRYLTVSPTETTTYTLTSGGLSANYTVNVCESADCSPSGSFNPLLLNTASNGLTSILGYGQTDANWKYSLTENGPYTSAIVSDNSHIPPNYSKTIWPNAQWIGPNGSLSTIRAGAYFFRVQFNLTAQEANSLVLDMQFMADNRVEAVTVNGVLVPNSATPGNTSYGFQSPNASSVTMQGHWVEGLNTVIVEIKDEGGFVGFVGQLNPAVSIPVSDVSCEEEEEETYVSVTDDTLAICKGNSVQLNASQAVSYSWLPAEGLSDPSIADPMASPLVTTMYYVTGTSASNLESYDSVLVVVNDKPHVSFGSGDTIKCSDQRIFLDVSYEGATVLWQNGSTNPVYMVSDTGTYSVQLTNQCGTVSDTLKVHPCCESLDIPNLFTPNGDNYNDYFYIGCLGSGGWDLKVFNRWGAIVYSNNDYQNKWNGNDASDGVYYYQLSKDNKGEYHGWVQIVR